MQCDIPPRVDAPQAAAPLEPFRFSFASGIWPRRRPRVHRVAHVALTRVRRRRIASAADRENFSKKEVTSVAAKKKAGGKKKAAKKSSKKK